MANRRGLIAFDLRECMDFDRLECQTVISMAFQNSCDDDLFG